MTAEEIRKYVDMVPSGGYNQQKVKILAEIAAQLAEHNAHMDRIEFLLENVISLNCGGLQVKVNQ